MPGVRQGEQANRQARGRLQPQPPSAATAQRVLVGAAVAALPARPVRVPVRVEETVVLGEDPPLGVEVEQHAGRGMADHVLGVQPAAFLGNTPSAGERVDVAWLRRVDSVADVPAVAARVACRLFVFGQPGLQELHQVSHDAPRSGHTSGSGGVRPSRSRGPGSRCSVRSGCTGRPAGRRSTW